MAPKVHKRKWDVRICDSDGQVTKSALSSIPCTELQVYMSVAKANGNSAGASHVSSWFPHWWWVEA